MPYDLHWLDQIISPPTSIILWFLQMKVNQAIPVSLLLLSLNFSFVLIFLEKQIFKKRQQIYEAAAPSFPCVKSQLILLYWAAIQELAFTWKKCTSRTLTFVWIIQWYFWGKEKICYMQDKYKNIGIWILEENSKRFTSMHA